MSIRAELDRFFGVPPVTLAQNDRIVLRRRVLALVQVGVTTPRDLADALPHHEAREIKRELHALMYHGVVKHNGKVGRGSQYQRAA